MRWTRIGEVQRAQWVREEIENEAERTTEKKKSGETETWIEARKTGLEADERTVRDSRMERRTSHRKSDKPCNAGCAI